VSGRILVVDDDLRMCELLEARLKKRGYAVAWRTSAAEALDALGSSESDVVVTDVNMRGMNGLELCERIVTNHPDVPVIVITAFGSLETAVGAIRVGAYDFVTKPLKIEELRLAVERALQHRELKQEVKRLRRVVEEGQGFSELLGRSPAIKGVQELVERVADSEVSVLITGESGTGKELVARELHRRSRRSAGPFVAINCAAMAAPLLESELFGHVRGAFTDAHAGREGLFRRADRGTLFLDEIGELPLSLQPKLLRALQERVVQPLGGDLEVPFNVRVVAATNRDLESEIEEGRFRQDLHFRINVVRIEMPPLRAMGSDVLTIAQHFVHRFAAQIDKNVVGLSPQAAERLLAFPWPGNVRELRNCIERAITLARYEHITVDDLPEKVRGYRASHLVVTGEDPSEVAPLDQVERRYILRVLDMANGNKTMAARLLGVDRKTLHRKLEQYGALRGPAES
jgi:two-component system response regulator HydG